MSKTFNIQYTVVYISKPLITIKRGVYMSKPLIYNIHTAGVFMSKPLIYNIQGCIWVNH